jgi:Kyakuja-Dileera-Zisupton transposase
VDAVGHRIEKLRKAAPKVYKPKVPDEAVDECEMAHDATNGSKNKETMDQFDDTGLMALICRHDIPLFFANMDTPGEQQKYAVALLEHFYSLIPPQATAAALYDVGCVLDRSLNLVSSTVLKSAYTHYFVV